MMKQRVKNRFYIPYSPYNSFSLYQEFFADYDLPMDTFFTNDMVQLVPSSSDSGFGLVVCSSDGTIYFWRDIAQSKRYDYFFECNLVHFS